MAVVPFDSIGIIKLYHLSMLTEQQSPKVVMDASIYSKLYCR